MKDSREPIEDPGDFQGLTAAHASLSSSIDRTPLKVAPATPLTEVIYQMSIGQADAPESFERVGRSGITCLDLRRSSYALVMAAERLIGIVTERDVVKLVAQNISLESLSVAEVMTQDLVTLQEPDLAYPFLVLSLFQQHRIRHLPVLGQHGQVLGVVTPQNVRQLLQATDLFRLHRVEEVMATHLVQALPSASVLELAQLMSTHRVSCVVITGVPIGAPPGALTERSPLGIVTKRDVVQFQALGLHLSTLKAETVMSTALVCLQPEDDLWTAHQTMDRLRVRRLVVADEHRILRGIITQISILAALDPVEMQKTISMLQQQVSHLQDERVQLLQTRTTQLEEQVQRTEERFRSIFNQTFQFIGLLEPDGTLIEVNQTALDFGGLQPATVINHPFWQAPWWTLSPATQAQLRAAIARAAQGEFVRYEVDVQGRDRIATIDFSLRPVFNDTGEVTLLIPEGRDISERKLAEAALRQSEQRYAKLAEAAPVGIFHADADGHCLYVNELWCQTTGLSPEQAMGSGWVQGLHPADRDPVVTEWYRAAQANQPFKLEYRFQTKPDRVTWVLGQAVAERHPDGHISGYIGTIVDITERKQAELKLAQLNQALEDRVVQRTAELEKSKTLYQQMHQKTPVMLHSIDQQGRIRYVSDYWLKTLGYPREEVIGHKSTDFLTPESREFAENTVLPDYFRTGVCSDIPYQIVTKGGDIIDVLLSATTHYDTSGRRISMAVMVDVTASNQALFREKELAQVTLQSIADAVITTDAAGQIRYLNPVAEQLTGWPLTEAEGLPLDTVFQIISESTRQPVENPVKCLLRAGHITGVANQTVLIDRRGKESSIEDSAAPIHDRQGQIIGAVIVFRDVTQARRLQNRLSWQASHDTLTGLPNRRQFEKILTEVLHTAPPPETRGYVLCYLDLDQFKVVNDTCGHTSGDELLRQVSRLLREKVRSADTVARLGGDEFGILLHQCSLTDAERITESLRETIQNFRFYWQDKTFRIGVSIGLVVLGEENQTLAEALGAADAACYAAKERGRNRIHIYQADDTVLLRQRGERQWSIRIRRALEEDRFRLYRQAIVSTTAAVPPLLAGYEVLLRMVDEDEAAPLVLPGTFIPAAERYGLMLEIDRWVVQTFFDYAERPHASRSSTAVTVLDGLHLINLSGASIGEPQFLRFLQQQFAQHAIPPASIGFEITETAAIADLAQATHFIRELKQLGCQFALDDFGSGMSSFAYLKNLPVDYLKIDGEFIQGIDEDAATSAIVESINHIGHVMGLKTIAESVETPALRDKLIDIGVDCIQGYVVSRPSPIIDG